MVKIIMHGCNGHMGQVISGLVEKDPDAEIVAGIDVADQGKNSCLALILSSPKRSRQRKKDAHKTLVFCCIFGTFKSW